MSYKQSPLNSESDSGIPFNHTTRLEVRFASRAVKLSELNDSLASGRS